MRAMTALRSLAHRWKLLCAYLAFVALAVGGCASSSGSLNGAEGTQAERAAACEVSAVPFAIKLDHDQDGNCTGGAFQLASAIDPHEDDLALARVRLLRENAVVADFHVTAISGFSGNAVLHLGCKAALCRMTAIGTDPVVVEIELRSGFTRRELRPVQSEGPVGR